MREADEKRREPGEAEAEREEIGAWKGNEEERIFLFRVRSSSSPPLPSSYLRHADVIIHTCLCYVQYSLRWSESNRARRHFADRSKRRKRQKTDSDR